MASDRLALDPLAASGDPMERLLARTSELEQQLAALRGGPSRQVVSFSGSQNVSTVAVAVGAAATFSASANNTPLDLYAEITASGTANVSTGGYVGLMARVNGVDKQIISYSSAVNVAIPSQRFYSHPPMNPPPGVAPLNAPSGVNGTGATLTVLVPAGPVTVQWYFDFPGTLTSNYTSALCVAGLRT